MNECISASFISMETTDSGRDFSLRGSFLFKRNNRVFDGHFPGRPILPAVVQIGCAGFLVSRAFRNVFDVECIKKAKFRQVVMPEETVHFDVRGLKVGGGLDIRCEIYKEDNIAVSDLYMTFRARNPGGRVP